MLSTQTTPPRTILLVTRDSLRIDMLQPTLADAGFTVLIARDGQQAITLVREQHPDLLVIERQLPDIDGFELCRLLRARTPVPIMLIANNAPAAEMIDALNHGVDDVLNGSFS